MTFSEVWDQSRHNVWFTISLAPSIVMAVVFVVLTPCVEWSSLRRTLKFVAASAAILATIVLYQQSVIEKWRLRRLAATTPAELMIATQDGANIAFAPIIGAAVSTAWMLLVEAFICTEALDLRRLRRLRRARAELRRQENAASQNPD